MIEPQSSCIIALVIVIMNMSPTPNMYVEILIPKMKFSKDGALRRCLRVTHKDGVLMNGISVIKNGKHKPHLSRARKPDRGAFMPCRDSRTRQKKDSFSFLIRTQPMISHGLFSTFFQLPFPLSLVKFLLEKYSVKS